MLRSILFTFFTLLVLVGGFALYWRMQPGTVSSAPMKSGAGIALPPPSNLTQMRIGPGKRGWANTFDDKGRLSSQFTAAEYTPRKDGTIKVDHPVNIFYLNDGQYIMVDGDTGVVFVDSAAGASSKSDVMQMGMQAPSRGLLKNVHVKLFSNRDAVRPTLWMDVNNLSFDNDTLRLSTESYTDDHGTTVAADRVPVVIRGNDYEFDGAGLTVRWNGRDHRLQLLEVAHGGRLEIKKGGMNALPGGQRGANAAFNVQPPTFGIRQSKQGDGPLVEALATADPKAAGLALPTTSATTQTVPVPYRAVFNDAVRILQGERQVARADVMTVDFLPAEQKNPATVKKPVEAKTIVATDPELAAPPAARKLTGETAVSSTTQPAPRWAATQPATTQPNNPPVTVYWTGKLRITPLDAEPVLPVTSGESAVRLVGSPVVFTPQGAEIHAAVASYRSPDGAIRLENSHAFPMVEVKQDRGMTFTTESVNYDPATSLATIRGQSHLNLPLEGQQASMTASWVDQGVLHFVGKSAQPQTVDHVDLFGQVKVDHPQFNLRSKELALDLEPAKTHAAADGQSGMTLKRATATGSAECRLLKPGQPDQGIDSDRLVLETGPGPDGKVTPRMVVADGNVRAFDPQQELRAGHLVARLRPLVASTKGKQDNQAVELESLFASSKVHSVLKNGAIADSDALRVNMEDGKSHIELSGKPATVKDGKGGSLSGPIIHISPEQSLVTVSGAGSMESVRSASANEPARPVKVTWTDSMNVNGPANTVDVAGHVKVTTTDTIGTVNTVFGDKAHLDLMDAKAATTAKAPATQSGLAMSDFGSKALKALTLTGHVHADSLLTEADGSVARHGQLWDCSELTYDAVSGRAEIPGAGQMLLEDHRKGNAPPGDLGNSRGTQGIRWSKSLVYDETKRQVIITGDVAMGIKQDQKDAQPMDLRCQVMTVDLAAVPTTGAVTGSTTAGKMDVSHVHAEAAVDFRAKELHVTAHTMDYDPAAHLVTLLGTDQEPGQLLDDTQGHSAQTFESLEWDAQTQEIKSVRGARGAVRR